MEQMNLSFEERNRTTLDTIDDFLSVQENARPKPVRAASDDNVDQVPENYSLEGLNIQGNVSLDKIVMAVKRFRSGERRPSGPNPRLNILLSGAPGCGKTAFVNYLAREVGAKLRTVRASDLLSKWIGESEKAIASAFRVAKQEDVVLFVDEVDGLVQDRTGATHSWEVTQVNELLQQMENFGGVMVAATNFDDNLDKAVLRRFTFKLKLDYLTEDGKRIFFERYFHDRMTEEECARLAAIDKLTPGDFRTVSDELFYLSEHETNAERLAALERESAAKAGKRLKIGF